jgi:hypothetical protein
LPRWRRNRTQPIDERDVVEFLARTPQVPDAAGWSLDVAGPDVMTYGHMIERIAEAMGVGRLPVGLARSLTPPASAVVAAVTGQPLELVRGCTASTRTGSIARSTTPSPSGSGSSRWGPGEGRARHRDRRARAACLRRGDGPAAP